MKKSLNFQINFTNRAIYTLITFSIFLLIGISVFALTPGVAPNPGHLIGEMAPPLNCETNQVLQWGGSTWTCTDSSSGGGLLGAPTVFDSSGNHTYNKNELASRIMVICTAGGGGGGADGKRPGSAGGTSIKVIENDLVGSTVAVTVGAGGVGGVYNQPPPGGSARSSGGDGESSSFGSFCSATGGVGGGSFRAQGGVGSGGDINLVGDGSGQTGISGGGSDSGGSSYWSGGGSGGGGGSRIESGLAGTHGSGGGAGSGGAFIANGGAGGDGIIVVWEY
tara:strand:- start:2270 stop:3106 length:837 start_codon:yes stop_codon:yes gene_type:complete